MDQKLSSKVKEWLEWDKNEATRSEIDRLYNAKDWKTLEKLLMTRMEFGTAGLRATMGPGYSQMNDLTIIQTSQGLLKYAKAQFKNLNSLGIIVGYDMRHNSKKWAFYLANIFINAGCKVYLFQDNYPTPLLAFGVRHCKTALGVMITASHNPKEDNGYKVYWSNGSQIISPHDKGISQCIDDCLIPEPASWKIDSVKTSPLCSDPMPELLQTYCELQRKSLCFTPEANKKCPYKFTYTAMHGVGWAAVRQICSTFGFPEPLIVDEQIQPDPEIPTVRYPNPEEGRSALNLAIAKANASSSRLILANDPDADRLAVAEKQTDGNWKIFSGNELGALFGWWIWFNWRKRNPKADASKVGMLSSTVSSKILHTMAEQEGFYFEETLTGFKWMGNRAQELAAEGVHILFAFEEAIGFMCSDVVFDKDGVSALVTMSELSTYTYNEGISLQDRLVKIYHQYGYHVTNNSYYFCHEPKKINAMFERIRHWPNNPSSVGYPQQLGRFRIVGVRDLTTGYDDAYSDLKPRLPVSKSSHCITFRFENGTTLTIRTSGTEPKIKFYSELRSKPNSNQSEESLIAELQELINQMVNDLYEPKKNGFTPRAS
ncbi:Phosphoglucomutase [Fasciola gigantica]|uniref:Phosphoglucomutase n=1 Tax=Fasciola gigantica TaxID=46835 RepID=A0A504Z3Z6_FASGI|nr:Phosphoglucomutase [Fasciola gigantica]